MTEKGQTVSVGSGALFGFWFLEKGRGLICVSSECAKPRTAEARKAARFFFAEPTRVSQDHARKTFFFLGRRILRNSNLSFSAAREASTPNRRQKKSSTTTRASKALRPSPGSFDAYWIGAQNHYSAERQR